VRRYRAVAQEDDWGGGVACVASVLGVSYAADGWMDPASGRIRKRLPEKVQQSLVLTPDDE
jgi:hypothetical protein